MDLISVLCILKWCMDITFFTFLMVIHEKFLTLNKKYLYWERTLMEKLQILYNGYFNLAGQREWNIENV